MGKFKAAGGASAAQIEAEIGYSSYDEASYGVPPKGPYRCRLRRLEATETGEKSNDPGQPMLKGMLIIDEPKGTKKAKYNGYIMNVYRVATEEQAGRMNQFLTALAGGQGPKAKALIKAFWTTGAVTDDEEMITKIGVMKFDPKGDGIPIGVNTRNDNYNDERRIAPASFIPIGDMPPPVAADDEDPDEETEEAAEEGVEEGDSEEVEERREELLELSLVALKKVAKEAGLKLADYKSLDKDGIAELIIDIEFPIDNEDDEPADEEEDEEGNDEAREEREEELSELSLVKLKAEAKKAGIKLADYKGLDEDELRELILDAEFPADSEESEDENGEEGDPEGEEGDDERAAREEELSELTLAKLKTIAKSLGMKLAEYRNLDEEELTAAILALEFPAEEDPDEDPDEEADEDEEEPPAKPARRGSAKTAKPARRTGKKGEPPF